MVRHLVPAGLLLAPLPLFAQPCLPCPPVPCQPVFVVPGCAPALGTVVQPKPPTVVPERMDGPKKPQVNADEGRNDHAKPAPAEAKRDEPKKGEPDKIAPVSGAERITPPAVPAVPPKPAPGKSEFDFPIPKAEPTPPAKPKEAEADLPPLGEKLPAQPEPKSGEKPKDAKPSFDFDIPKPAQPTEANKTTVRSSPLADARLTAADVYPRTGPGPKTVVFVNKSGRDVLLTVGGTTTTLPSKTVLTVDAGAKIVWQVGGEAERTETLPADGGGLDVVIRN